MGRTLVANVLKILLLLLILCILKLFCICFNCKWMYSTCRHGTIFFLKLGFCIFVDFMYLYTLSYKKTHVYSYNTWLQRQFNIFVINLRDTYKGKVATFRQVIDIHRTELQSKESYWNEMLEVRYKYLKRFLSYILNGMTLK